MYVCMCIANLGFQCLWGDTDSMWTKQCTWTTSETPTTLWWVLVHKPVSLAETDVFQTLCQLFQCHLTILCHHDAYEIRFIYFHGGYFVCVRGRRDLLLCLSNHPFAIACCSSSVSGTTSSCLMDNAWAIKIVDGTMKEQLGQQCRTASTSANLLQSQLEDRIEHLVRK